MACTVEQGSKCSRDMLFANKCHYNRPAEWILTISKLTCSNWIVLNFVVISKVFPNLSCTVIYYQTCQDHRRVFLLPHFTVLNTDAQKPLASQEYNKSCACCTTLHTECAHISNDTLWEAFWAQ